MNLITEEQLKNLGIGAYWEAPLNETFKTYSIDTVQRQASFLGQACHESNNLRILEENLNYSANRLMKVWPKRFPTLEIAKEYEYNPEKLANFVYGDRKDLGNFEEGDGWKFHGRGIFQLTGRYNYQACSDGICSPVIDAPEKLLTSKYAALSAGWFWKKNKLNSLADIKDYTAITKKVNGGTHGLQERIMFTEKVLKLFNGG